eukprot:1040498-Amphidinium_carterae.1
MFQALVGELKLPQLAYTSLINERDKYPACMLGLERPCKPYSRPTVLAFLMFQKPRIYPLPNPKIDCMFVFDSPRLIDCIILGSGLGAMVDTWLFDPHMCEEKLALVQGRITMLEEKASVKKPIFLLF